jgi:hypothetical protein
MKLRQAAAAATFCAAMLSAASASAVTVTSYSDATAFHALGTITQTTSWPGFPEADNTVLGPTFTDGALSFSGDQLEVFGKNYPGYNQPQNVLVNNLIGPINADVTATGSNMLSFDLANMKGSREFTLSLYFFDGAGDDSEVLGKSTIAASTGFEFYGFALPTGAYFTGFSISSNNTPEDLATDSATFVGISQVELGHTGSPLGGCRDTSVACTGPGVPEPSVWALMILGFGGCGAALRARSRPGAVA